MLRWCFPNARKKVGDWSTNYGSVSKAILWHCSTHRKEQSVGEILTFEIFIDTLHQLYGASLTNQRGLSSGSRALDTEVLKIVKVVGTQWVATITSTVQAAWKIIQDCLLSTRYTIQSKLQCADLELFLNFSFILGPFFNNA